MDQSFLACVFLSILQYYYNVDSYGTFVPCILLYCSLFMVLCYGVILSIIVYSCITLTMYEKVHYKAFVAL